MYLVVMRGIIVYNYWRMDLRDKKVIEGFFNWLDGLCTMSCSLVNMSEWLWSFAEVCHSLMLTYPASGIYIYQSLPSLEHNIYPSLNIL